MKDYLTDIVQHTLPLGVLGLLKITGDAASTAIDAFPERDRDVVLKARFHAPSADFVGVFGIPNIPTLNTILNIPEYREDAVIKMQHETRNGETLPASIHFSNANGDFQNTFRLQLKEIINNNVRVAKFNEPQWDISFEPSVGSIQRFKYMSQAVSDAKVYRFYTDGGNLKVSFGDASTHAGDYIFASGVKDAMRTGWTWPVNIFNTILNLSGDKIINLSDQGIMQITVDSGLIVYNYIMVAQSK